MSRSAAKTGVGPTVLVAIEQLFPKNERIIEDDVAFRILPFGMRALVRLMHPDVVRKWIIRATDRSIPGIWSWIMCRKRYIDEKLIEYIGQVDAVINLGAGFDTRAYRLPAVSRRPVWELDQRESIRLKQKRIRKVFGVVPSHVRLVPVDFEQGELRAVLASHGYSTSMRTFFIWEGVTQYLTESGIRSTFDFLAGVAPGSHLVLTYIRKDFLDGRVMYGWQKAYKKFVLKEKIWLFGKDPETWRDFVQQWGWRVVDDVGTDVLAERYVRPTGRSFPSALVEHILHVTKV